jgi:hypothetical protein
VRTKTIFLVLVLLTSLFVGCTNQSAPPVTQTTSQATSQTASASTLDAVTSASIVNKADAFEKAISKNGTWIIAIINDLTVDKDLVVDGVFKNGKKDAAGKDILQRKIALYAQDANRNITARYTLTAPKLTFNSPEGSIQHGTFKGDLYVAVKNFQLIDAKVDGNVYFTTDEAKSSFKMDKTSTVTGKQELKK